MCYLASPRTSVPGTGPSVYVHRMSELIYGGYISNHKKMPTLWSSYISSDSLVSFPPVLSYCLNNPMKQAPLSYCADEEEVEVWIVK